MARRMHIKTRKRLPAYSRLRGVSWFTLQLAEHKEKGWLHHCMTSMLFSAFCLEAFLNHLGELKIPYWEPLKKKLSPSEKLQVLSTHLGFSPNFGVRPYQTFDSIFKLRNLLVHAKTETLEREDSIVLEPGEMPPEPLSEWEKLVDIDSAKRFVDDTKAIVEDLCSHAGIDKSNAFENETVSWTGEYTNDEAKPSS